MNNAVSMSFASTPFSVLICRGNTGLSWPYIGKAHS